MLNILNTKEIMIATNSIKIAFWIFIFFLAVSCKNTSKKKTSPKGNITEQSTFNNQSKTLELFSVATIKKDLNNDGKEDVFEALNVRGWETSEPGDFREIKINLNETDKYQNFNNNESWIKLSNMNVNKELLKFKTSNND